MKEEKFNFIKIILSIIISIFTIIGFAKAIETKVQVSAKVLLTPENCYTTCVSQCRNQCGK